jgi:hypothetical protein
MVSGELLTLHTAASLHCAAPRTVAVFTCMLMKGNSEQGVFLIHTIQEVIFRLDKKKLFYAMFRNCPLSCLVHT